MVIKDDDNEPFHVKVLPPTAGVPEGSAAQFTFSVPKSRSLPIVVNWSLEDGTADTTDYTYTGEIDPNSRPYATIPPGARTTTVTVQTTADTVVEGAETFSVGITRAGMDRDVVPFSTDKATALILDDDTATLSVSGPQEPVPEGDAVNFSVTLSAAVATRCGCFG